MKKTIDEYIKILMYMIFGVIIIMSTYLIIINVHHYKALSSKIVVSESDIDYVNYKKNVNEIEQKLQKVQNNDYKLSLNRVYNALKSDGVFRLIPNAKLTYRDLYNLNNYFINDIINNCWISDLNLINKNKSNTDIVNALINNSNYLNKHFIDNGLTLYESINDNKIKDDYSAIIKNYYIFSNVVLDLVKGE